MNMNQTSQQFRKNRMAESMIPDHPPGFTQTSFFKEFEEKFGKKPASYTEVKVVNGCAIINGIKIQVTTTDYYSRPTPTQTVIRVMKDNATYKQEMAEWIKIYKQHAGTYLDQYNKWYQAQLQNRMNAVERYKAVKHSITQ